MKPTFKTILVCALILTCCMAVTVPSFANMPAPPPRLPQNDPTTFEWKEDPAQYNWLPSLPTTIESENDPAPTPPIPMPQPKPVKKGCGSGGLAEVAMLCFIATAAIQLRRISRNRLDKTYSQATIDE